MKRILKWVPRISIAHYTRVRIIFEKIRYMDGGGGWVRRWKIRHIEWSVLANGMKKWIRFCCIPWSVGIKIWEFYLWQKLSVQFRFENLIIGREECPPPFCGSDGSFAQDVFRCWKITGWVLDGEVRKLCSKLVLDFVSSYLEASASQILIAKFWSRCWDRFWMHIILCTRLRRLSW